MAVEMGRDPADALLLFSAHAVGMPDADRAWMRSMAKSCMARCEGKVPLRIVKEDSLFEDHSASLGDNQNWLVLILVVVVLALRRHRRRCCL